MLEIYPVSASFPLVKPKKIDRDDERPQQQQSRKKPEVGEANVEPVLHIDEIV